MTPRVSTSRAAERTVYHLHHDESGASASILPSYGFNLFDLRLPIGGAVRPIVAADPDFAANPSRPARNGFPILFPFPGRIRDARYSFDGKDYELVPNKPPHAIHGFAHEAKWDVIDHGTTGQGAATITGRFQISKDAPDALHRWPADARLDVTYDLFADALMFTATVTNPSDRPLPWGLGVHSYFRLPFDGRADRSGAEVVVDASRYWVLRDGLPTGEQSAVDGTPFDYRNGRSMSALEADDALTGLAHERGGGTARLVDRGLGAELRLRYPDAVREMVLFTPPGPGGVVAVEPYTQMADAFALRAMGVDAGMRVMAPGGSATVVLVVQAAETEPRRDIGTAPDAALSS